MGLRQFSPYILTLEEQANPVRTKEILCIPQKGFQGRAGPCGDDIEGLRWQVFHPIILDRDGEHHLFGSRQQEGALLGCGFMQGDFDPVPQQFRQHQAGEPGAGTEIRQGRSLR